MVQVYHGALSNVDEVKEMSLFEANQLLGEGWVLLSIHTGTTLEHREVPGKNGKPRLQAFSLRTIVYVLGKLRSD